MGWGFITRLDLVIVSFFIALNMKSLFLFLQMALGLLVLNAAGMAQTNPDGVPQSTTNLPPPNPATAQQVANYITTANHFFTQGNYGAAVEYFTKALVLEPEMPEIYFMRGFMYVMQRNYATAEADYTECLRLQPNDVDVFESRAFARAMQDNLTGALADYDEALRLNPLLASAYAARAEIRGQLDMRELACEDFRRAQELGYNVRIPLACR
jgi:tetratricopeptide (TPR) repeat protein